MVLEVLILFRRQGNLAKLNAEPSGSGRLCRTPHSVRFDQGEPLAQELKVISDSYDLILYLSQRIGKFPRQHRYSLGLSMEQRLQVFLALLIRAKFTSAAEEKSRLLRDANIELPAFRRRPLAEFDFHLLDPARCSRHGMLRKSMDGASRRFAA